jgi:hypothetical protein
MIFFQAGNRLLSLARRGMIGATRFEERATDVVKTLIFVQDTQATQKYWNEQGQNQHQYANAKQFHHFLPLFEESLTSLPRQIGAVHVLIPHDAKKREGQKRSQTHAKARARGSKTGKSGKTRKAEERGKAKGKEPGVFQTTKSLLRYL